MPNSIPKKILTKYAKSLRQNATDAEKILWHHLKARQIEGIKFRRQQPIENKIVDFVSFETRLVVELDGGQHAGDKIKDQKRDRFLKKNGFRVLRFWNHEVLQNLDAVLVKIRRMCLKYEKGVVTLPQPLPSREGS